MLSGRNSGPGLGARGNTVPIWARKIPLIIGVVIFFVGIRVGSWWSSPAAPPVVHTSAHSPVSAVEAQLRSSHHDVASARQAPPAPAPAAVHAPPPATDHVINKALPPVIPATKSEWCLDDLPCGMSVCGCNGWQAILKHTPWESFYARYPDPPVQSVPPDRISPKYIGDIQGGVVVEIGGNNGRDAKSFLSYKPRVFHTYEPLKSFADQLRAELPSVSPATKVYVHEYALGNSTYTATIFGENEASTLVKGVLKDQAQVGSTRISVRDVIAELDSLGVDHIDLFSMNCEGCEYEVLPALVCSGWMERIKNFLIAVHWGNNPEKYEILCKVQAMLARTHHPTMCNVNWHAYSSFIGKPEPPAKHPFPTGPRRGDFLEYFGRMPPLPKSAPWKQG